MANKVNTTYSANLGTSNVKVQPTQAITPTTVDTSYQGNSNALYGGHDATWWQNQYARQTDAESQAMVRKAADYYGYKIPETVAQPQTTAQTLNSSNSNVASYAEYSQTTPTQNNVQPTAQATTYAANTNQEQAAATVPTSQVQTEPIDSYEEFLRKRGEGYQETLDKTKQSIEEQKQNAIDQAELQRLEAQRQAEVTREREVADSRSSYEQNKATYGANAEQMADMGLTGSGYGDYVNAQAYATQRAEQQAANSSAETAKQNAQYVADQNKLAAEQQANSDKLNAELTYAENMANNDAAIAQYRQQKEDEAKAKAEQEENNKKAYYAELLSYANNGTFNKEQLSELATQYGLDENQIKTLTDSADKYISNKQAENYNKFLSSTDLDGFDTIKAALKNGDISQEQYNNLYAQYQTNYYDNYSYSIESDFSTANTNDIDNAYKRGYISQEQYNSLKAKYNSGIQNAVTAATIFTPNGVQLTKEQAQALSDKLDKLKESGWITSETDAKIDANFNSIYNASDDDGGGGCYAKGTQITIADGSQVAVEELKEGDNVLVFNHNTGEIDTSPISFIFYDSQKEYDVLKLTFDNAANIEVLYGHGFFDTGLKKYVLINASNVSEYLGHKFCYITQENGVYKQEIVTLTGYEEYKAETECYSVLTEKHFNSIANGILTVTDDGNKPANLLKGFYNIFDMDNTYKYMPEKMAADISKYGLLDYSVLKDFVTEKQFNMFNGAYLGVAIGKGLVTLDEVIAYIQKFLNK